MRLGSAALTERELLAALLGGGEAATGLAGALLCDGGLKALAQRDPEALRAERGLGPARAAVLLAALELGRRLGRSTEQRPQLRTPREIHRHLSPTFAALPREVFHVLCFNARNVLLRNVRVAQGTVDACLVDPREVFSAALSAKATAVVLAHNHPSGDPEPSLADRTLTRQLAEAGRVLGIRVLDHLVFGDGSYVSLLERNLMPEVGGEVERRWACGR